MAKSGKYQIQHSQNFLVNRRLVEQLVADAEIGPNDTVLEIGPGKGIITRELAKQAGHVIAIEKDDRLARALSRHASLPDNVTVYCSDAVTIPLPSTPYRVFANIPFRHTAGIVGKLTTGVAPPMDSRLVVQREAADRFMVGRESTLRAQQLYPFFEVNVVHTFDRRDFSPAPNVECVLLQISQRQQPLINIDDVARYQQTIDVIFSSWQASLGEAIKTALPRLAAQDVMKEGTIRRALAFRPSEVQPEIWMQLFDRLSKRDDDRVWQEVTRKYERNESNRAQIDRPTRANKRGRALGN